MPTLSASERRAQSVLGRACGRESTDSPARSQRPTAAVSGRDGRRAPLSQGGGCATLTRARGSTRSGVRVFRTGGRASHFVLRAGVSRDDVRRYGSYGGRTDMDVAALPCPGRRSQQRGLQPCRRAESRPDLPTRALVEVHEPLVETGRFERRRGRPDDGQ